MKDRWRSLVEDASQAFVQDFRYAEEMAKQAVSLKARQQKKAEDQDSRTV